MKVTFVGGSLDGTTRDREVWGRWCVVPGDRHGRTRETYELAVVKHADDSERTYEFRLAKVERCSIEGSHEGPCKYEVVG